MIDTIKVLIPLRESQYKRITEIVFQSDRQQWGLFNPQTGELTLRRVSGLTETDGESFHREIRWDVSGTWREDDTYLVVELSLPKLWMKHNIHLLYDFTAALKLLKVMLEKHFRLSRSKLPDVMTWKVNRVDVCYAWRFPSQGLAQQYLDSLKRLHFPRKKPVIYPTSIYFKGSTYSVKFYLKHPEFRHHDLPVLLKAKESLEFVEHLEKKAEGVLRFEATLRYRYLKRHDILFVGDLAKPLIEIEVDEQLANSTENVDMAIEAIIAYNSEDMYVDSEEAFLANMEDGKYFTMPEGQEVYTISQAINNGEMFCYKHKQGGFHIRRRDNPTAILQFFLRKYIGENSGMESVDVVKAKLLKAYKPVKASRLISFWLYVQRFGTQEAQSMFGRDSYYASKRDLKQAGVSLVEPPKNVVHIDRDFYSAFRMAVPSPYVTNKFDDFRSSDNILNFVPKESAT